MSEPADTIDSCIVTTLQKASQRCDRAGVIHNKDVRLRCTQAQEVAMYRLKNLILQSKEATERGPASANWVSLLQLAREAGQVKAVDLFTGTESKELPSGIPQIIKKAKEVSDAAVFDLDRCLVKHWPMKKSISQPDTPVNGDSSPYQVRIQSTTLGSKYVMVTHPDGTEDYPVLCQDGTVEIIKGVPQSVMDEVSRLFQVLKSEGRAVPVGRCVRGRPLTQQTQNDSWVSSL